MINSPGGDIFAAALYNMLMDYTGKVTVKIDGLRAPLLSLLWLAAMVYVAGIHDDDP